MSDSMEDKGRETEALTDAISETVNEAQRDLNDPTMDEVTPRQESLVEEYVSNAEEYGPFDTSTGANGAHYAPADANPFKAEGLICANCELYQPISDTEGRCAIVEGPLTDGHIEPDAICKLWVIPESKLAASEAAREAVMSTETRVIGATDLRNNPNLLNELREGDGNVTEVRVAPSDLECRANEDGSWTLVGMASVFDSQSEDLGGFREVISRGAFRKVLKREGLDVLALWNHDSQLILGRTTSGTLQLRETPQGLEYQVTVAPTTYGNDLKVLMERGDVHASSFAFRVDSTGQQWEHQPDGTLLRTITEFSDLTDVSPVSVPAYSATSATVARNQDSSDHDSEQAAQGAAAQQGERAESDVRQTDDAKSARDSKAFWLAHMRLNRRA